MITYRVSRDFKKKFKSLEFLGILKKILLFHIQYVKRHILLQNRKMKLFVNENYKVVYWNFYWKRIKSPNYRVFLYIVN
jgi:hypothetical protein